MKHFFISQQAEPFVQWLAAFPNAELMVHVNTSLLTEDCFVWLLDDYPAAPELVVQLKAQNTPVVVLSLTPSVGESVKFFESGASGYCHALAASVMLHQVVESVQAGGIWIGVELMQQMVHRLVLSEAKVQAPSLYMASLTAKEKQVAELVAQGLTNKEVAKSMDITDRTVKAHLSAVFEKLQVRDRIQLALLVHA